MWMVPWDINMFITLSVRCDVVGRRLVVSKLMEGCLVALLVVGLGCRALGRLGRALLVVGLGWRALLLRLCGNVGGRCRMSGDGDDGARRRGMTGDA